MIGQAGKGVVRQQRNGADVARQLWIGSHRKRMEWRVQRNGSNGTSLAGAGADMQRRVR